MMKERKTSGVISSGASSAFYFCFAHTLSSIANLNKYLYIKKVACVLLKIKDAKFVESTQKLFFSLSRRWQ